MKKSGKFFVFLITIVMVIYGWSSVTHFNETKKAFTTTPVSSGIKQPTPFASATSIIEPTPSPTNVVEIIPVCQKSNVQTTISSNFGISGTIIYQKNMQGLYSVGGSAITYSKLPVNQEQEFVTLGFSPDGSWFAFAPIQPSKSSEITFQTPQIVLLSENGKRIEQTLSIKNFSNELEYHHHLAGIGRNGYWINNKTLYIPLYSASLNSNETLNTDPLPKMFDPFNADWREDLLKDLPADTKSKEKGLSPDLTRMLYMVGIDELFLKDLEKGVHILNYKAPIGYYGTLILWSPNSKVVAYATLSDPSENSVVLISRDGIAEQIMGPNSPVSGPYATNLSWSSDGKYLAILAWKGEGEENFVFIYDVETKKFISQCPIAPSNNITAKLIWSPDDQYLAYGAMDSPLLIMNVQSGEKIQLVDKGRAVGWSNKFPVVWP